VAYATNINGFKLGCHMMLFVDGCHLSGLYKRTMLVITLVTPFSFPRLVICNVSFLQAPSSTGQFAHLAHCNISVLHHGKQFEVRGIPVVSGT